MKDSLYLAPERSRNWRNSICVRMWPARRRLHRGFRHVSRKSWLDRPLVPFEEVERHYPPDPSRSSLRIVIRG